MKNAHEKAYRLFNAPVKRGLHELRVICKKLKLPDRIEDGIVPLFDVVSAEVATPPRSHVLDYVYYKQAKRRSPAALFLGNSIFNLREDAHDQATIRPLVVTADDLSD